MSTRFPKVIGLLAGLALLIAPAQAMAQTATPAAGTITVSTTGTASAPAETAVIIITLSGDQSMMPYPADATADAMTSTAGAAIDPTPVIEALVAAGVPADAITVVSQPFMGEWGPAFSPLPVSLEVTLATPEPAFISTLLEATRTTALANGWFVNQFGVLYQVSDCSAIEQAARVDAMANARTSAEAQAAAMDTTIGAAIASRDSNIYAMPTTMTAGCGADAMLLQTSKIYMASSFDPELPAQVTLSVSMEVTFQMP